MKRKSTVFVQKILWKTTFFVRKIISKLPGLCTVRDLERWETSKFRDPAPSRDERRGRVNPQGRQGSLL